MDEYLFQVNISKALTCMLKKYDYFKSIFPDINDIDAWELLHNASFDLLKKFKIKLLFNNKLKIEIEDRKKNESWLELNNYYLISRKLSIDETEHLSNEDINNRLTASDNIFNTLDKTTETIIEEQQFEYNSNPEIINPYYEKDKKKILLPEASEQIVLGSGITMGIIGQGGMARVYKIYNEDLSVFRAVKIITEVEGDVGKNLSDRMFTEAKIAAQINHPNVVITHGVGKWNDFTYMEMEYVEGHDIANHLSAIKKLPPVVACAMGLCVSNGLVSAHNKTYSLFGKKYKGIIHRDLKPANIMLANNGQVKIMDFGIARPIEIGFHTRTGVFTGSLQYAAPEQLDSFGIDQRTDIYSFGTVLYEMLSGRKTFPDGNSQSLLRAKLNNTFIPLRDMRLKIPHSIAKVVDKCIAVDKNDRFDSSSDLTNALEGALYRLTRERSDAVLLDYVYNRKTNSTKNRFFMNGTKKWLKIFGRG